MVKIKAKITRYLNDNLMCDYDDGSFESFDCSLLEILEPINFKGMMYIYFSSPQEPISPWRMIGKIVKFSIDEKYLTGNHDIFYGALKNVLFLIP